MGNSYILKKGVSDLGDLLNGLAAANLLAQGGGRIFYLDPTNGSDANDGRSPAKAVKTLPVAYAKLRDGYHDILYYIAGTSSISLAAEFTWAKSYTHLIGVCAPTQVGQRARIFATAGDLDLSPLITISGSGCVFANLYIFHGVDDADALINVEVTGDRNYFENVHFAGGGHATMAIDGCASLKLNGAYENTFVDCVIGVDTVAAASGVAGLLFAGAASARNVFKNCLFSLWAGDAAAIFVETVGVNMVDRFTIFDNCMFMNLGTTMTVAMAIEAGTDPANKRFLLKDCASIGCTDWSSLAAMVYLNNGAITGGTNSGQFVVTS